ncbi:MAG: DUF2062 domain-containing protein [Sulfurimonas sp.]|nr:DUF2062 domain-containing protein [Sulfurimonas sp.]
MIRKIFKKISTNKKLKTFIKHHKVPFEYLSSSRKMVSKAVFIGLFIAFIPMPMQMLAVLAVMPFTRFNVPIAIAMCWVSNPFTMPLIYYIEYLTGSFILGIETTPVEMTIEWFSNNLKDIFIPLYIGAAFYSIVFSSLAYYLINHLWRSSIKRNKKLHRKDRG